MEGNSLRLLIVIDDEQRTEALYRLVAVGGLFRISITKEKNMNNAEFIKWVKTLTTDDLAGTGLKTPAKAKAVCLVLATYGDYATGENIKMAWTTIAREACVSRTTAHKVRDWLAGNNVLVETGKTERNITVYRIQAVDHLAWTTESGDDSEQLSILEDQLSITDDQLSILEGQLSTLHGQDTTLDITDNTKNTKDAPVLAPLRTVTSSNDEIRAEFNSLVAFTKWELISNVEDEELVIDSASKQDESQAAPAALPGRNDLAARTAADWKFAAMRGLTDEEKAFQRAEFMAREPVRTSPTAVSVEW